MPKWGRVKEIICPFCNQKAIRLVAVINRAAKAKAPLYCNMACAGLTRRKNKTIAQKKIEKRRYDMDYRKENKAVLKVKKSKAFQNRSQQRREYEKEYRKKNMQRHVKYLQNDEYRKWKKKYDQEYRAKLLGGEFWESYLLILQLDKELDEKMSWYDRQMDKGTLNKANQRRKVYERESIRR